jgi:hypothetical protein
MGKLVLSPDTLSNNPEAGLLEFDGVAPRISFGTLNRSVIPGMQYYRLDSTLRGLNSTAVQNVLGVGCTLESNTTYAFELFYNIRKTAGTTAHTVRNLFGGTATLNNIGYSVLMAQSSTTFPVSGTPGTTVVYGLYSQQSTETTITPSISIASQAVYPFIRGTVSVNTGGTFIPQYSLSATPGGEYETQIGSYFLIYPISTTGANTSIGNWS